LTVYDLVHLDGRVALVTEYVSGQDLAECLDDEKDAIPLRAAMAVIEEMAGALSAAYNIMGPDGVPMNLVHRDIKPSNIRISQAGGAKLLDFGIAKGAVEREAKTGTGLVIGTVGYIAPERVTEEQLTPASDIYALGCVLFEVMGGRRLFKKVNKRLFTEMALNADPHDQFIRHNLKQIEAECPGVVLSLLQSLLAHDHILRPTADELEETCEDIIAQIGGLKLRRWCKARDWTDTEAEVEGGELVGRTIEETTLSFDRKVRQPTSEPRDETFAMDVFGEGPPAEFTTPLPFEQSEIMDLRPPANVDRAKAPTPATMASSPIAALPRAEPKNKWTSTERLMFLGVGVVIIIAVYAVFFSSLGPTGTVTPTPETPVSEKSVPDKATPDKAEPETP
ncbi:MAG: serine/threonine protein kinase, partial [Proteobacteria bacterium]|nr:serine/threonine protein kinase [Pseudomonadota bacterium]